MTAPEFVDWCGAVVEAKALRMAWARVMEPHLARVMARLLDERPVDVDLVVAVSDELHVCRIENNAMKETTT